MPSSIEDRRRELTVIAARVAALPVLDPGRGSGEPEFDADGLPV